MPRLTKISTKSGDSGMTSLAGQQRVSKASFRVQAYGSVDELNSHVGVAIAFGLSERLVQELTLVQNELFHLGSDLSYLEEDKSKLSIPQIEERHIGRLSALVEDFSKKLGPLKNFILPGGSLGAAQLQVARAVCRRAERDVIALAESEPIGPFVLPYLNRLSDVLFLMARFENQSKGVPESLWDSHA